MTKSILKSGPRLGPRSALAVVAAAGLMGVAACGNGERSEEPIETEALVVETPEGTELIEWVLFDDAVAVLADAHERFVEEESEAEAAALTAVSETFDRIAEGAAAEDGRALRSSALELRTLSNDFPKDLVTHRRVLGDVLGRAFVALARHHLTVAGRLAAEGEAIEAGRHVAAAARDIEEGFRVSEVGIPDPTATNLDAAARTAERWMEGDSPDQETVRAVRRSVREESERLANALGARRH